MPIWCTDVRCLNYLKLYIINFGPNEFILFDNTIYMNILPEDDEGVEDEGDARFILRLQQQQHSTNKSTNTKNIPPAAAPMIMAKLSSSFLPPGKPT